jgi:LuxR family transcriptional regulator, maltose regulon positive regulatory protein
VQGAARLLAVARQRGALTHPLPARDWAKFEGVLAAPADIPAAVAPVQEPLTERELQLLRWLAQGLSNKENSTRGHITLPKTTWRLKHVFAKLGVTTRMVAVFRAQELRLLDGRPPSPLEGGAAERA